MLAALATEVQVALVVAGGTSAAAALPALLNRRTNRELRSSLGEPDHRGSILDILVEIHKDMKNVKAGMFTMSTRIDRLESEREEPPANID